jgi:uncharacterized protein YbjQ (UPF0145 family)
MAMKKFMQPLIVLGIGLAMTSLAYPRDIKRHLPIGTALEAKDLQPKTDGSITMSFGKETTREGSKILRSDVALGKVTTRGKSNDSACNSAFLSALVELQKRAKQEGANAVVNIVSYYKRVEMSSTTEYECHEGSGYMAVALKGDFVKIGN